MRKLGLTNGLDGPGGNLPLMDTSTRPFDLPVTHRRSVRRGRGGGYTFLAVAALTVAAIGPWVTHWSRAQPAEHPAAEVAYHICPAASCPGYPVPAQVRGITIAALENYLLFTKAVQAQIQAAQGWHINAVRLQIVQDKLVGKGGRRYSQGYMRDIRHIVRYALHHHLDVILNAQTEISMGFPGNENLPTAATYAFWRHMAHYYAHNHHVVFDLFNEPRFCNWRQWLRSMQSLVDYVRQVGSVNQLWVEGLWWGSTFAGLPHPLRGQGLVYSYHHPGSPWPWQGWVPGAKPGITGPPLWNRAFGNLARDGLPMVDGEFVNFMGGYYWPHSTQMVSQYLRYLAVRHIGMVAWSLQPGIMTATTRLGSAVSEPQGAGRLIWRYFHHLPLPAGGYRVEIVPPHFAR